jgi:carbon monoxide dehydrogenase subunit G
MELTNSFVVPAGIDAAWAHLLDVESLAPCFPGATLISHDGDSFTGAVKVKLGPVTLTYGGVARFVSTDPQTHRAVIDAAGKDARGTSTAAATVHTQLVAEAPDRTRVEVNTELAITGRPAQFGRGVMEDVAGRIIDQFAGNLAASMTTMPVEAVSPSEGTEAPPTGPPSEDTGPGPAAQTRSSNADALDLVGAAGLPILKRLAPVAAGLMIVALIVWWVRRR